MITIYFITSACMQDIRKRFQDPIIRFTFKEIKKAHIPVLKKFVPVNIVVTASI